MGKNQTDTMNCPSRVDEVLDHDGWNQNPSSLSGDTTTRADLNGIVNARDRRENQNIEPDDRGEFIADSEHDAQKFGRLREGISLFQCFPRPSESSRRRGSEGVASRPEIRGFYWTRIHDSGGIHRSRQLLDRCRGWLYLQVQASVYYSNVQPFCHLPTVAVHQTWHCYRFESCRALQGALA